MKPSPSNVFFILGILFLLFGVLLYLSYWYFVWGFASLIIGVIFILFTKKSWKFKLICIIIPVGFVGVSFYQSFAPREIYLIPDNFEGKFRVVYGENCGEQPTYENGRRIMRIPDNGILIIQPKFQAGWVDNEYYLVDSNAKRIKLNLLFDYKDRLTKSPGILMGPSGSMGGAMPDGGSSSESPLAIHFTDFTLYNKDTAAIDDRQYDIMEKRFDSLTTVLVDKCRLTKNKSIR